MPVSARAGLPTNSKRRARIKPIAVRGQMNLAVLKTIWTDDPVEFHGKYFNVARSIIGAKPVQKPLPPIYLAAYAPAALKRAATLANGWMPAGIPLDGMRAMIAQMRRLAKAAARNPDSLEVIVGANVAITAEPLGADRPIFAGSRAQVQDDIVAAKELGASEIFFMIFPDGSNKDLIDRMERFRTLA